MHPSDRHLEPKNGLHSADLSQDTPVLFERPVLCDADDHVVVSLLASLNESLNHLAFSPWQALKSVGKLAKVVGVPAALLCFAVLALHSVAFAETEQIYHPEIPSSRPCHHCVPEDCAPPDCGDSLCCDAGIHGRAAISHGRFLSDPSGDRFVDHNVALTASTCRSLLFVFLSSPTPPPSASCPPTAGVPPLSGRSIVTHLAPKHGPPSR